MSYSENRLSKNQADDRDKEFYELLDQVHQLEQILDDSESIKRNELEGILFTKVANMSALLVERMQENSFSKSLTAVSPLQIVEEYTNDHPEIDLSIWREFRQIRNKFVHGKLAEFPIDALVKKVVPEFVKEYELLSEKAR